MGTAMAIVRMSDTAQIRPESRRGGVICACCRGMMVGLGRFSVQCLFRYTRIGCQQTQGSGEISLQVLHKSVEHADRGFAPTCLDMRQVGGTEPNSMPHLTNAASPLFPELLNIRAKSFAHNHS